MGGMENQNRDRQVPWWQIRCKVRVVHSREEKLDVVQSKGKGNAQCGWEQGKED
jgi:hypothetical protein